MKYQTQLEIALKAVAKAATVCRRIRSSESCEAAISKKDRSPVTIADFASQAVIIRELLTAFPDAKIVAEEDANQFAAVKGSELEAEMMAAICEVVPDATFELAKDWISAGGYEGGAEGGFWTLDPIDGTKGFIRNQQYAIALAYIVDGEPVVGLLGCPNYPVASEQVENPVAGAETGMCFYAVKGKGAFSLSLAELDAGSPIDRSMAIQAATLSNVSEARMCESVESAHSSHSDSDQIKTKLGIKNEPFRIDSQCKYAAVASGQASIYLRLPTSESYREKIWDHAAGCIVTTEAGGVVADVKGNALDFSLGRTLENNRGIIATIPAIQDQVLTAVSDVLGL